MAKLSKSDIERLECLDCVQLMKQEGFDVVEQTPKATKFICPFHAEKNGSFCVSPQGNGKQIWKCYGCDAKGVGAINLLAKLRGIDRKTHLLDLCDELMRMFNIIPGESSEKDDYRRARELDIASNEIVYKYCDWNKSHLQALGITDACNASDTGLLLEKAFGCKAVESYISEGKWNEKKGKEVSWEVKATDDYPIFDFHYEDSDGWWSKKYEPNCKTGHKFTWWYQGGSKKEDIAGILYGDADFMNAWNGGAIADSFGDHYVVSDSGNEDEDDSSGKKRTLFKRLVLCSGPRDAINVWMNSDCHVCWPHSESVKVGRTMLKKLASLAKEVFVLFDIDQTGKRRSNEIALSCLDFKVIRLPEQMKNIICSRTGKPCKDVSEYFSDYCKQYNDRTSRSAFEGLLRTAKSMQFWHKRAQRQNTGNGGRVAVTKYEILNRNMEVFLPALGMWQYEDAKGVCKFIVEHERKIKMVSEERGMAEQKAIELMKDYIFDNYEYYHPELEEAIGVSTKISSKTLGQIPKIELNLNSYGEDFDYFFFKNGALRVTDDGWKLQPYSQLEYDVNEDTIIDAYWNATKYEDGNLFGLFKIEYNEFYLKAAEKEHEAELKTLKSPEDIQQCNENYKWQCMLNRYKLTWLKPVEECPRFVQMLWNTCRFFWEIEEQGVPLAEWQEKFCAIHFINKIVAIGYLLSRFRTTRRQYIVEATDYEVSDGKRNGRNGKSTITDLLIPLVRKVCRINGQNFKAKNELVGLNFQEFIQSVHQLIAIDDLNKSVQLDLFINLCQSIIIKTLYKNEIHLSFEESPKIVINHNTQFMNDNSGGTYRGRLWTMYFSDFYHEESDDGKRSLRTPETEFGDLLEDSGQELQQTREMLAYALHFYLKENKLRGADVRVQAPIEQRGALQKRLELVRDNIFVQWAGLFFRKPHHYGRPMEIHSMCLDYLDFRNQKVPANEIILLNKDTLSKKVTEFVNKMKIFVEQTQKFYHIVYNPKEVFAEAKGYSDDGKYGKTATMRVAAWCYLADDEGNFYYEDENTGELRLRREKRLTEGSMNRCLYFYRTKDIPKSVSEILPATAKDEDEIGFVN